MTFHYSDDMLKRIHLDPGLPVANPSIATWQNPPHRLSEIRSKTLPTEADIVLVGSGITACSIARTLLSSTSSLSKKPRIVVLEARTLCSGASGRNGGHLRDSPFMYFGYLKEKFGHESAKKMAAFRGSHIAEIFQVAKEEGIFDIAEIEETEAVDVVFQEEKWKETKEEVDDYKRTEKATYPEVLEEDTAKIRFCLPKAVGALVYPAATHSTYQLVAGIFSRLLDKYGDLLRIETTTPVESISILPQQPGPYTFKVSTPRGDIRSRHVVHCTNSHVSHLIPGLRGKIFPVREHMTEHSFPLPKREDGTERSWAFLWRKGFDYFIHRRGYSTRKPAVLLGGALAISGDEGMGEFGIASDADQGIFISAYLRGLLPTLFTTQKETELRSSWTGIMGWSADLIPWVGAVPSLLTLRSPNPAVRNEGTEKWESVSGREWISAGYSGEGMTHAWLCGKAIAFMVLGLEEEEKVANWLPEEYRVTEKRVKEADVRKLKELY